MVFGYGVLKNQICNYVFQYNAIDYLLCNSIKPFILIKEFCLRKTSLNKNYHWFINYGWSIISLKFKYVGSFTNWNYYILWIINLAEII